MRGYLALVLAGLIVAGCAGTDLGATDSKEPGVEPKYQSSTSATRPKPKAENVSPTSEATTSTASTVPGFIGTSDPTIEQSLVSCSAASEPLELAADSETSAQQEDMRRRLAEAIRTCNFSFVEEQFLLSGEMGYFWAYAIDASLPPAEYLVAGENRGLEVALDIARALNGISEDGPPDSRRWVHGDMRVGITEDGYLVEVSSSD